MSYDTLKNNESPFVEEEDLGNELISSPFNPTLIKIRRDPFTLGQIVDKIQHNEVVFETPYQRKADLWGEKEQSRLIESVILRLPLPSFYFDEIDNINQRWNVIDGLQRCCAFKNFIIEKTLRLQNLEFLTQYNNYTFDDLPADLRRRIMQTPITTIIIEKGTPDFVKFNIFKRINTGGLILTSQEIRHAMNQGKAAKSLARMASMTEFKQATCYRIPTERMLDQEFVNRFVAFYVIGACGYTPDLDTFLNMGMAKLNAMNDSEIMQMETAFRKAMKTAYAIWGDDSFRKRTNINDRRRPLNKTLFELVSVCFAKLSQVDCDDLIKLRHQVKSEFIELNKNNKFFNAISSGIANKDCVLTRHELFDNFLSSILNQTLNV